MSGPMVDLLARAHAEWPAAWLEDAAFLEHVTARMPEGDAAPEVLSTLRAADMFLAAACCAGHPDAIRTFVDTYFVEVSRAKKRFEKLDTCEDDIKQQLYLKLFTTGASGAAPRIGQYLGRGDLRGWFRAVAVRALLDLAAQTSVERPLPESLLSSLMPSAVSPEVLLLRGTYGEELRAAFSEAADRLSFRDKNVLRYVLAEGLSLDQLSAVYGVHRATAGRWLERARTALGGHVRDTLKERLALSDTEFESIVRLALSHVDITVERYLAAR